MTRMTAAMIPRAAGAKPAGPAQYTYICIQRTARDASLICVYARRVHVVESTRRRNPNTSVIRITNLPDGANTQVRGRAPPARLPPRVLASQPRDGYTSTPRRAAPNLHQQPVLRRPSSLFNV